MSVERKAALIDLVAWLGRVSTEASRKASSLQASGMPGAAQAQELRRIADALDAMQPAPEVAS